MFGPSPHRPRSLRLGTSFVAFLRRKLLAAAIVALGFGTALAQEPAAAGAPTAEPAIVGDRTPAETVVEIRIQGNFSLPDAEVIALAGVTPGDAAGPDLEETVHARLEASGPGSRRSTCAAAIAR